VDVEPVTACVRRDLEMNGLALVDADVGGEALDACVTRSGDIPLTGRIARLGVLASDRVDDRWTARALGLRAGRKTQHEYRGDCQNDYQRAIEHPQKLGFLSH